MSDQVPKVRAIRSLWTFDQFRPQDWLGRRCCFRSRMVVGSIFLQKVDSSTRSRMSWTEMVVILFLLHIKFRGYQSLKFMVIWPF